MFKAVFGEAVREEEIPKALAEEIRAAAERSENFIVLIFI